MLTAVHFTEVKVSDQDRALAFYTEKLGCTVHTDADYMAGSRWIMLRLPGGGETLLHFSRRRNSDRDTVPSLVILTDDIEADHERLSAAGVECADAPQAAPWDGSQSYFLCYDSENNQVLIQTPAEG